MGTTRATLRARGGFPGELLAVDRTWARAPPQGSDGGPLARWKCTLVVVSRARGHRATKPLVRPTVYPDPA